MLDTFPKVLYHVLLMRRKQNYVKFNETTVK